MKALLLSSEDGGSGSTRAAYRLHQSLLEVGIDSQMMVQTKYSDDRTVKGASSSSGIGQATTGLRVTLDRLPLRFSNKAPKASYSLQWLPDGLASQISQFNPDLINLHWVCKGFVRIETLATLKRPIVWTMRDMWAFTGGCHYSYDCDRYTESCGQCPQLGSQRSADLSRWIWQRKAKAWKNLDLTVVALSHWIGDCARASSLFGDRRIEVISNGIDTTLYRPIDRRLARELLGLPQDKKLILFGAINATADQRKGFHLLQPALQDLRSVFSQDEVELVVFGSSKPANPPDLGFFCHYMGKLSDDLALALLYSAADVFIAPSTQENLANTVLESLACGVPCVAFNIGGMPDLIQHQQNGYLAEPYRIDDLTQGVAWVLEDGERHQKLSVTARERIERELTLEHTAQRYLKLFNELLSR